MTYEYDIDYVHASCIIQSYNASSLLEHPATTTATTTTLTHYKLVLILHDRVPHLSHLESHIPTSRPR